MPSDGRSPGRGLCGLSMLTVRLICVGSLKERYWVEACREYEKRLSAFCRLTAVQVEESTPEKEKTVILRAAEGYVIALCIDGQSMSSPQLARRLEQLQMTHSKISLIIGGSDGLAPDVRRRADLCLSFSPMTFPHQMMRVILLEQLYRAFTIQRHMAYHK